MPVVTLTAEAGGLRFEQTALGWSEGFSPDGELFALVRLRVTPRSAVPPDDIASVLGPSGIRKRWQLGPADGARQVCLRIPFRRPAEATAISGTEFETVLAQTAGFWRQEVAEKGARISVPEKRVDEARKAWLAYSMLNVDKINGYPEPHDGAGFYEAIFGYSAALHCVALDRMGQHERAARYIATMLHFQAPDGLYVQNYGLPDMGALLLAINEHYRTTRDLEWLRSVAPHITAAGRWIIRTRAKAPADGMMRGLIKYRPYCDYAEPTYDYYTDVYCCVGLEAAADSLAALRMAGSAARFRREAQAYRADILRSMDLAAVRKRGMMALPMEPDTHRLLKASDYGGGDYYGLVASCLLETGFLPPSDHRAFRITDLMERRAGLLAGLCRFGTGGIDHAYTYGYLQTQLKRGDIRRYLLGFYGMLAYGMSRDTYSGVECTTCVTGANAATLPHLYSCTQQLQTLRMMLVREDGDTLIIGDAIPRAWLADGKQVEVQQAPTWFGDVSFVIASQVTQGRITVSLAAPTAAPPQAVRIRLRHPGQLPIRGVRCEGAARVRHHGEVVGLQLTQGPVELTVTYDKWAG